MDLLCFGLLELRSSVGLAPTDGGCLTVETQDVVYSLRLVFSGQASTSDLASVRTPVRAGAFNFIHSIHKTFNRSNCSAVCRIICSSLFS